MLSCDLFTQLQTVQNVKQKINILVFITGALLFGMRPQEEAIYNFNFKCKNLFEFEFLLGADVSKNYVYSMKVSNLQSNPGSHMIFWQNHVHENYIIPVFFLIIIIIIKVKIQSVSSVLSVPSCWSLTIIIVWENHKQWQQTDCLGLAKLSSKH